MVIVGMLGVMHAKAYTRGRAVSKQQQTKASSRAFVRGRLVGLGERGSEAEVCVVAAPTTPARRGAP